MNELTSRYLISRNKYTLKEVTQLIIDCDGHLFGVGCKASSEVCNLYNDISYTMVCEV